MASTESMVALINNIIFEFLKVRKMRYVDESFSPSYEKYTIKKYAAELSQSGGYVTIRAINTVSRGKRNKVIIVLFKEDNESSLTQSVVKQTLEEVHKGNDDTLDEVIIISNKENCKKQSIISALNHYIIDNPQTSYDKDGKIVYYNLYIFNPFCTNITEHVQYDEHTIISNEEMEILSKSTYKALNNFPIVMSHDPAIIWLGARHGQIVKVRSMSHITGEVITYRIVRYVSLESRKYV